MTEMTLPAVTRSQRRTAIAALGLDPDTTIVVSIAADWLTIVAADPAPVVTDGVLQTHTIAGPITNEPAAADEVEEES